MSRIFRIAKVDFIKTVIGTTVLGLNTKITMVFGNKYQIDKYCERQNAMNGTASKWDFVNVNDAIDIDLAALVNLTEVMAESETAVPDAGTVIWFQRSDQHKFNVTVPDLEHSKFLTPVTINHSEGFKPNTQEDCQNLINYLEAIKESLPKGSN